MNYNARVTMHIYIYIQWFFWKFSSRSLFFSLSLDSTGTYYRGYIILYFDSFIHFIPIFFPLRPRSRLLPFLNWSIVILYIYLQVMNKILTFSEIWILLFHSCLELVRSFFFLLLLRVYLLFDTNIIIIHCFQE